MDGSPLRAAHRLLDEALGGLGRAAGPIASDEELLSVLMICEGITRRLDRLTVDTIAALDRRGTFTERGYPSPAGALCDLLGWERFESRRRVTAAEHVCEPISLDGTVRPARLPATAVAFGAGTASLRHVEVIARVLGNAAAERLAPEVWAGAEAQLAAKTSEYTPTELQVWGTALVTALDADGPEPDDRDPEPVTELHLTRNPDGVGGRLKGRFDDPALYDAITTVIDAKSAPLTADDDRTPAERQAEALAEVCGYVLDHGDEVPECGGHRPHLTVIIGLEDLEQRARAAMLHFGGTVSPESLRMLACDAGIVPIVMNGAGQPLDVGRATRTIPDGLRRAIHARDRGCAHPGCGRPPSWTQIHHIDPWEQGGETTLANCVALCRYHHRLLQRASGWTVRIHHGLPEFLPPTWIDPKRTPRRRALPHLADTS